MAEIAEGGGCLPVSAADSAAIEAGFERLASDAALRARLAAEARARPLRRWRDYADALLAELAATPVLPRALLVEGSAGAADPAPLEGAGVAVRRLHWRTASRALLPGAARAPEQPAPGDGRLGGFWAVLPAATCADAAEAAEIVAAAQGLGLRVALEAPPAPGSDWLRTLAAADLALFADAAARDAALAAALRELPRTATLRERFRVGTGAAALRAIAPDLPRTAAAGPPEPVRRVFYWVGLTVDAALQHRRAARDAPPRRRAGAARGGGGAGEVGRGRAPHRADLRRRRAKPSPASTARRFGPARRCRSGSPANGCCCPRSRSATPRRRAARSASRAVSACAPPPCSTT